MQFAATRQLVRLSAQSMSGTDDAARASMGRALESTPTAEMRSKLDLAGVAAFSEEEIDALSKNFNMWLEDSLNKQNKPLSSWYNLFADIDADGSGFITFDELQDVVRHKLKQGPSILADDKLEALWCFLDADNSNSILPGEIATFLKRGASEHKAKAFNKGPKTELGMGQAGMGRALESTPTAQMRASVEAALTEDEVTELSKKMNVRSRRTTAARLASRHRLRLRLRAHRAAAA